MAVQRQQSELMRKYGTALDAAVRKHAADPIQVGQMRLPGGIKNGVARLVGLEFKKIEEGKNNAGDYMYQATGVVVEPASVTVNGQEVAVAGLQTRQFRTLGNVTSSRGTISLEENVAWVLNEMKKLGGEALFANAGGGDLEALGAAIVQAAPYFAFETRESPAVLNPDGTEKYAARVWETWFGTGPIPDGYAPPELDAGADNTGPANGHAPAAAPTRAAAPKANGVGKAPARAPAKAPPPAEEPDLMALAEAADGDDPDGAGREAMIEAVKALGWTDEQVNDWAESWTALAEHIEGGGGPPDLGEAPEGAADEDDGAMKVGSMYLYTPLDPKTKKPAVNPKTKKPLRVECEVTAINEAKETVDLLNLDDKKTKYRAVPWDQLISE